MSQSRFDQLMKGKVEKIGIGSYAVVYRGMYDENVVALKVIEGEKNVSNNEINILQKLAQLNAPHVINYYDSAFQEGVSNLYISCCIVLEYVSHSLSHHIINKTFFEWSLRFQIMIEIASGIAFLHDHGIIHCDIKSENILLTKENNVKIADFGLAVDIGIDNQNESCAGTPEWTAPEVLSSKPNTKKPDIYSLAITLWEIATWSFPYVGKSVFEVIKLVSHENLREKIPDTMPKNIASLIEWGWKANPDERPTAEQVLLQLELN